MNCLIVGEKGVGKSRYIKSLKNNRLDDCIFDIEDIPPIDINFIEIAYTDDIYGYQPHCAIIMFTFRSAKSVSKWYNTLHNEYPNIPIVLVMNTDKDIRINGTELKYFIIAQDASIDELQKPLHYILQERTVTF